MRDFFCNVVPIPQIIIMQVGDGVIGTNVILDGRSSVNTMIVDSPIQFNGKWIQQDGTTMFTEVTTVSNKC